MADPDLLTEIREAVRDGRYRVSLHYWKRVAESHERPLPTTIEQALLQDAPRIIVPDDGGDLRGPRCRIACEDGHGKEMHVIVAYGNVSLVGIVTAFYPTATDHIVV